MLNFGICYGHNINNVATWTVIARCGGSTIDRPKAETQKVASMASVLVLLSLQIQTQYTGSVVPLAIFVFSLLHLLMIKSRLYFSSFVNVIHIVRRKHIKLKTSSLDGMQKISFLRRRWSNLISLTRCRLPEIYLRRVFQFSIQFFQFVTFFDLFQ